MKKVIIYDDFYPNPHEVRNAILETEFEENKNMNYPGNNSVCVNLQPEMIDVISNIIGEPIKPAEGSSCGHFRISLEKDKQKQLIHVDFPQGNFNISWAGVCYLSLPEHYTNEDGSLKDAGTKFWKYKKNGMEELPLTTEGAAQCGFNSPNDLAKFMYKEGMNTDLWYTTMNVPIKFNRLILFKPNMWHSNAELFGDCKENGRFIQLFFFQPDIQPTFGWNSKCQIV